MAAWLAQHALPGARAGGRRGMLDPADVAGADGAATQRRGLRTRLGGELRLPPVGAGLRSGFRRLPPHHPRGADLPGPTTGLVGRQGRAGVGRRVVPAWELPGLVLVDSGRSPKRVPCAGLSPAAGGAPDRQFRDLPTRLFGAGALPRRAGARVEAAAAASALVSRRGGGRVGRALVWTRGPGLRHRPLLPPVGGGRPRPPRGGGHPSLSAPVDRGSPLAARPRLRFRLPYGAGAECGGIRRGPW